MANPYQSSNSRDAQRGGGNRPTGRDEYVPDLDLSQVKFGDKLEPQLFNEIARHCAKVIGDNTKCNKPSQLRRFYDELEMWTLKAEQNEEKFAEYQPFILMLNAKAAYANGRDLVDSNFVKLLSHCLREATDVKTLGHAKLFFEAFLGFYKEVRPKENG